jgi:DNA polymerase-3 subunit epsilon
MRQIVLDVETTGLDPSQGHRIIDLGCVEIIDRQLTGNDFQRYINPERRIDIGALKVHNISESFLAGMPVFSEIAQEFLDYIRGAELLIHNAPFDVGFLDHELKRLNSRPGTITDYCTVVDTLPLARKLNPGHANYKLDSLAKRFEVNKDRRFHGALVDATILAHVYLLMTGGQKGLDLEESGAVAQAERVTRPVESCMAVDGSLTLPVVHASEEEISAHQAFLALLQDKSGGKCIWKE